MSVQLLCRSYQILPVLGNRFYAEPAFPKDELNALTYSNLRKGYTEQKSFEVVRSSHKHTINRHLTPSL
jgi:hypothetical protein